MHSNLLVRIDLNKSKFSKSQKKIADYIQENYDKAANMTAAKIGEIVNVSESTVVRFADALGYDGYPELCKAMQDLLKDKLNTLGRIDVTTSRIVDGDVVESVLNQDIDKIRRTISEVSREDFNNAVKYISKAKRIFIFGIKSSSYIASFLAYYLDLIFGNVQLLNTMSKTSTFEKLFRISEDDVMIGFSFPRYSTLAVDSLKFAKDKGAKIVSITDNESSPLVEYSDATLYSKSDIASIVDSLVAPLSLVNALLVAIVIENKDRVKDTFSSLEDCWSEQNIYTYTIDKEEKNE